MQFGETPLSDALGAILAHAVPGPEGMLRKGHVVTSADLAFFRDAGRTHVVVARLDADDVGEDEAAGRLAAAVAGAGVDAEAPATGRSNLFAEQAGVLVVDRAGIDRLNAADPGITIATLPAFAAVEAGRMVATVKIIPFALPRAHVDVALAGLTATAPLLRVAPFRPLTVGVVSTLLPGLKPSVIDKTLKVLGSRLQPAGARILADRRVAHEPAELAAALADLAPKVDLLIVYGASAVVDIDDVIPAAIRDAGGRVDHFGMPVDPGNLLLIGRLAGRPVIGAPGCARSPKENGFDWVLQRLLAGLNVTPADIVGLGVGGLLMDIVSRPAPRAGTTESPDKAHRRIGAVVLAGGRSSRMEGGHKLLARLDGQPLVAHAVDAASTGGCDPVIVVTGHGADAIRAAVDDAAVTFVHNPDFADGMSTSLKAGLAALPDDVEAAVILLGDMPRVDGALVARLAAAYAPERGQLIAVPVHEGRRGNPVLIARRFFPELMRVTGDTGAREVIRSAPEAVAEVAADAAIFLDLDTREALDAAGGTFS